MVSREDKRKVNGGGKGIGLGGRLERGKRERVRGELKKK